LIGRRFGNPRPGLTVTMPMCPVCGTPTTAPVDPPIPPPVRSADPRSRHIWCRRPASVDCRRRVDLTLSPTVDRRFVGRRRTICAAHGRSASLLSATMGAGDWSALRCAGPNRGPRADHFAASTRNWPRRRDPALSFPGADGRAAGSRLGRPIPGLAEWMAKGPASTTSGSTAASRRSTRHWRDRCRGYVRKQRRSRSALGT